MTFGKAPELVRKVLAKLVTGEKNTPHHNTTVPLNTEQQRYVRTLDKKQLGVTKMSIQGRVFRRCIDPSCTPTLTTHSTELSLTLENAPEPI